MHRFTILDLLLGTALIALHMAAFPAEAKTGGSDWAGLLYLTPTMITCLLHLRLRLKIPVAMAVHYLATAAWTFLHAVGLNYAINAYNRSSSNPRRDYQLLVYANAWNDTVEMLGWGIVLAATYGGICYTAVTASTATALPSTALDRTRGEPSDARESPS